MITDLNSEHFAVEYEFLLIITISLMRNSKHFPDRKAILYFDLNK